MSQHCDYFIPECFELQKMLFVTSFCLLEHFISHSHMSYNIGIQPRQVFPSFDGDTRNTFFHNNFIGIFLSTVQQICRHHLKAISSNLSYQSCDMLPPNLHCCTTIYVWVLEYYVVYVFPILKLEKPQDDQRWTVEGQLCRTANA